MLVFILVSTGTYGHNHMTATKGEAFTGDMMEEGESGSR